MKDKSEKPARIVSRILIGKLKETGATNRELAERAQISFRAIAEARDGFDPVELRGTKKKLGVVSSMTRLASCLDVDPRKVLDELGIDTSEASVKRQMERAREASLLKSSDEDPVIRAIRTRGFPSFGVVSWSPFTDDLGGGSFAKLLVRSVIGSLNPDWDREVGVRPPERDFVEAERRLLSNEADRPDCVLGLYDLPWRRQEGVNVVPLPGLHVRVGGLCTEPFSWNQVLANNPRSPIPHALLIRGDVGDRLLRGPVDYPSAKVVRPALDTFDPLEIARRIGKDAQSDFRDGFLFVADGPLVQSVKALLPEGKWHVVGANDECRTAPVVRFGFGLTRDSSHFTSLLEEAISGDLLGRALPRTVSLYLRLLESDHTNQVGFDPDDLERRESGLALRFVQIAQELDPDQARATLSKAARDPEQIREYFDRVMPPKSRGQA